MFFKVTLEGWVLPWASKGSFESFLGQINRTCFPSSAKLRAVSKRSEVFPTSGGPHNRILSIPVTISASKSKEDVLSWPSASDSPQEGLLMWNKRDNILTRRCLLTCARNLPPGDILMRRGLGTRLLISYKTVLFKRKIFRKTNLGNQNKI